MCLKARCVVWCRAFLYIYYCINYCAGVGFGALIVMIGCGLNVLYRSSARCSEVEMNLASIGNTPLVELTKLALNGGRLFAKCEHMNPSGSHKDRTYLNIVTVLEGEGAIHKGMTLVDCSTGNGGAALAWIGREKGYKVKIFMPEGMTQERKDQIHAYGASFIETPKETFLIGAADAAREYVQRHSDGHMFFLDQSSTLLNKFAWHACGEEIVSALNRVSMTPDYFICSIGTGGTFCGIAEVLKRDYPMIKTVGIEVDSSAPLYSARRGLEFEHCPHNLMGLGAGEVSINTVTELIDDVVVVAGDAAWDRMKAFVVEDEFDIGPTCGANLIVCEHLAQLNQGKNIVTVFFDNAWKYKSRWGGVYPEYVEIK